MIRKALLALAFGLAASCAYAQAPSPADVGISKGTPDVFKLKGSDNAWTPFGSVDPSTHIFIPGTNGAIAPNDCVKWGPGLTSAGAACNSVTGGAHPANQLTIYTNHSGLVANVTTPTEAWTVQQQGFYAPGDGGDAVYQWSLTSYCVGGTSSAPVAADGIGCVLPIGQSASTAGRYLLSTRGELSARAVGMLPGGQDNSPFVQTLMSAISPGSFNENTMTVVLPAVLGQRQTYYYFSQPFPISRNMRFDCKSESVAGESAVVLVFPPGVDGVLQESAYLMSDPNWGQSTIRGCQIMSLGYGTATMGAIGTNQLTGVNMNSFVDAAFMTFPASCNPYAGGNQCTVGVGDGIIAMTNWVPPNSSLNVAPGAYVGASNPTARTLTLAAPYTFIGQLVANTSAFYDLPASQAYTVQTTTGSNSATVTAGPRPLKPGDMLWSDAFLFGSSVNSVSSTTGFPQTITVNDVTLYHAANASVTHTSGSPGKLWLIPAGVKRRVQGSMYNSAIWGFGVGLDMICHSGTNPATGCNSSYDEHNALTRNLVGRLVRGNNSGVSTAIANVYGSNFIADEVEAGSIGSNYFSEENNSQDSGTSIYGTLVICGGQNFSNFIGSYLSGQAGGPCMGNDAAGNPAIGVKADDSTLPPALFLNSTYGLGYISRGQFNGPWAFGGADSYTTTAEVATPSGNVLAIPTSNVFYPGIAVTDLTHPVIPAGTTATVIWGGNVKLSNALTGGGVQVGDQIQFQNQAPGGRGGPCIQVVPGLAGSGVNGMAFDKGCAGHGFSIAYNGYLGGWNVGSMFMPDADYQGYNLGIPVLSNGLELGDTNNDYNGMERLLDSGTGAPTEAYHLQGDTRLNQHPVPGGVLAWTDTPSFTTTLAAAVTGGTTTSVAVAACPSPALPAGTPIADTTNASPNPNVNLSRTLGRMSDCTGTTLTLQAVSTSSGLSGDTIQFLQFYPAARVANDPGGTSWPLGSPTTIASLARCTSETIGFGVVKNGATGKADDDEVGKEGSSVRPVFCDGKKWTYLGGGIH